ncbi:MAG: hypothetical protein QXF79_00220, partial [Ignisphaera sp.]
LRKTQYHVFSVKGGVTVVEDTSKQSSTDMYIKVNPRLVNSMKCESILTMHVCYNVVTGYKEILDLDAIA